MVVKCSKVMANTLNKCIPEDSSIQKFSLEIMDPSDYEFFTGRNCLDDFEYDKNYKAICKAIKVIYKPECYALNTYLTKNDLVNCYRHSDGTLENFIEQVFNLTEV